MSDIFLEKEQRLFGDKNTFAIEVIHDPKFQPKGFLPDGYLFGEIWMWFQNELVGYKDGTVCLLSVPYDCFRNALSKRYEQEWVKAPGSSNEDRRKHIDKVLYGIVDGQFIDTDEYDEGIYKMYDCFNFMTGSCECFDSHKTYMVWGRSDM